jgi:PBP1b-binding outer membrane lipoprotein LpoB
MNHPSKLIVVFSLAVSLLLVGCSSYTKQATTSTQAAENPSADIGSPSEIHSAPTVMTGDGLPQREHMLIYLDPWILGNT